MYIGSLTDCDLPANTSVSLLDAAIPGSLPVLNRYCVVQTVKACLALNCHVNDRSSFDRKHYFYRDLPAGYQITQKFQPIGVKGHVTLGKVDGLDHMVKVGIQQIQLEQDSARSIVDIVDGREQSLVDLNRAGVALIEIVSEPDMSSAEEATAFIKNVQAILQTCGVSEVSMDDGTVRVDVNISLPDDQGKLGPRCELKNMVSLKLIQKAINCELSRQRSLKANGQPIISTTRLYDVDTDSTTVSRSKESDMDYRYFPDPDLPTVKITADVIEHLRNQIPELPHQRKQRFLDMGLSLEQSRQLVDTLVAADLFEQALALKYTESAQVDYPRSDRNPYKLAALITNTIFGEVGDISMSLKEVVETGRLTAVQISSLNDAIDERVIVPHQGKNLLAKWLTEDSIRSRPAWTVFDELKKSRGNATKSVLGFAERQELIDNLTAIVKDNPKALNDLRQQSPAGSKKDGKAKAKVFTFFAGRLMRSVSGRCDETMLRDVLSEVLVNSYGIDQALYMQWLQQDQNKSKKNAK